jgi:CHASE2 domain-containing sensor protein
MKPSSSYIVLFRRMSLGAACLLVACLLSLALHHTWLIRPLEEANQTALLKLQQRPLSSNIKVIEIDQEFFQSYFSGRTPLDPEKLRRIIERVDAGHPTAIGVDFDTCAWSKSIRESLLNSSASIVWAVPGEATKDQKRIKISPACTSLLSTQQYGVPVTEDVDGLPLEYKQHLVIEDGSKVDSFTTALRKATPVAAENQSDASIKTAVEEKESFVLPLFSTESDPSVEPLSKLWYTLNGHNESALQNTFARKIVLIGGNYKEASDRYNTHSGAMPGVEVMANILDTEINHKAIRCASTQLFLAADLLVGLMLIYAVYRLSRFGRWVEYSLLLLGVPAIAALVCVFLFTVLHLYLSMMPIVAGALMHKFVEHSLEHMELHKRLSVIERSLLRSP